MKAIKKRTIIAMAFMSMFHFGFTQSTLPEAKNKSGIEFSLVSDQNSPPLFELKTNNKEETKFYVLVKDGAGDLLYSETLKGKSILRKYQLDISQADVTDQLNVRFEVSVLNSKERFVYNVTRSSLAFKEIIVAKL